jgi:hypothetical protein
MTDRTRYLFLILSTIDISDNPLSYTRVRSVYSSEERLNQSIQTVESIKKTFSDSAKILYIEAGHTDYYNYFSDKVDDYKYISNKKLSESINSKHKAIGETSMILSAKEFIELHDFDILIKISGRYLINDHFDYSLFSKEEYTFRINQTVLSKFKGFLKFNVYSYSTVLYAVPNKKFSSFIKKIKLINRIASSGLSLESLMYCFFKNKKNIALKLLNVDGNVAVNGNFVQL